MTAVMQNNGSDLLKLARRFNCFYLSGLHDGVCHPFIVEGHQVGLVRPDIFKHLKRFPEVFHINGKFVELNPAFRDYKERSSRVAEVLQHLRKENALCSLKGWRDEYQRHLSKICWRWKGQQYAYLASETTASVSPGTSITQLLVSAFGYNKGVPPNRHGQRLLKTRFGRTFIDRIVSGKWDCFVSGGLAAGYGVLQTTIKEAAEEASVDSELVKKLVPAGCVSFYFESERGLFPNTEYVYDLELPLTFKPRNTDGEVQAFELLPVADCVQRMLSPQFKTTSAPVLLDFLIRKGYITPENEPNYRHLVELLHIPLQAIYTWPCADAIATNGKRETGDN